MFHLVTPFPFLLDFSFYAPLFLRLALGVYVLALGFSIKSNNSNNSQVPEVSGDANTSINTPPMSPWVMIARGLLIISGLSLILGLYMQIGAIIVAILMGIFLFDKRTHLTSDLRPAELSLLLIIAFSLMVTGAGPLAFDFPL